MKEHIIAFLIYSFFGAILEHMNYFITRLLNPSKPYKALANPIITGFPLYAIGAYLAVSINNLFSNQNIIIRILLIAIALSVLEYLVGLYVGAGKGSYVYDSNGNRLIDSWDYSNKNYNIGGIISLDHFIIWGILGYIIITIHPKLINKLKGCL